MLKRFIFLVKYYFFFVIIFILQKPLFMLFHIGSFGDGVTFKDWFLVMWHGLPLDLSMAGYISILPFLFVTLSVWIKPALLKKMIRIYTIVIIAVVTIIFSVDLDLYTYWNFRLDTTPLAFMKTPKNAIASFSAGLVIRQIIILAVYFTALFFLYKKLVENTISEFKPVKWPYSIVLLVISAFLFLPIRGGLSDATMNVGWVYFSNNMFLNHAAINPFWNFLNALSKQENFEGMYQFMDKKDADAIFSTIMNSTGDAESLQVIKGEKPNVIFVLLESFSANVIGTLGGLDDVTPNLNSLSKEGVLFTNFYATSFRTDRGVASIMSAYPSQPKNSVMKYPTKTNDLPNIGKTLTHEGYDLSFYYGGDENFTNMRSYLVNAGFQHIVSDKDFSKKDYSSRWGAADHVVFDKMLDDINNRESSRPFFNVMLTLSSHEPFTVPMPDKFSGGNNELYKNSVYYTDSCIGDFIAKAKKQEWWDNTVIVFVSDHSFAYPEGMPMHVPERYHIIMLWLGGAVDTTMEVSKTGYQPDLAATLLKQLGMDHSEFIFSKDLLDNSTPEFAYYSYNHGVGFIDADGHCVTDLNTNEVILENNAAGCEKGRAFLQYSFEDFAGR